MGFFDGLKKMLQGPAHVQGGDDEGNVALHEDFGTVDKNAAGVSQTQAAMGGSIRLGYAASESAEVVADDLATEAAPPDLDP
jgi:hypothetical protein